MNEKWIVGVSGGPDSMALLHQLHKQGFDVVAAHVNYHKRSTSNRDQLTVSRFCAEHNIPFEVIDYEESEGNFQSAARAFRYRFYKTLVIRYGATGVATGHHWDDAFETFLMNQESNRKSLQIGIAPMTQIMGMKVWRPLLQCYKVDLIQYCTKHHIPYEIDETNVDVSYTRNRIRNRIALMSLDRKQALIEEYEKNKEEHAALFEIIESYGVKLKNPFNIEDYKNIDRELRGSVLRYWFEKEGFLPYEMTEKNVEELDRQICGGKAQISLDDTTLSVSYGEVCLHKELSFSYHLDSLTFHKTKHYRLHETGATIEGLMLRDEDFPICIRSPKPKDAIQMRFGTKSLNRFFIDRKIPIHQRKQWLVVENSVKEVIFVSKMGCDIHHYSNNPNVFVLKL